MVPIVLDEQERERERVVDAFPPTSGCMTAIKPCSWRIAAAPRIAQDLFVSERSVQRWLRAFRLRGLDGLRIPPSKGQPLKIPESLVPTIQQ